MLAGTAFGAYGEGYMRVSYANSRENLERSARQGRRVSQESGLEGAAHRRLALDPGSRDRASRGRRRRLGQSRGSRVDAGRAPCIRGGRRRGRGDASRPDRRGAARRGGPQLRVVANVAVGYDNTDVAACTERGIRFTNTPGVLTDATADIAFALILMVTRRLAEGERLIRAQRPWKWNPRFMLASGIQGKTLGIVGLGQIGAATAAAARRSGWTSCTRAAAARMPRSREELDARFLDLDELLETADVVSLHCPLTDETRHLITAERLRRMKPTAFL